MTYQAGWSQLGTDFAPKFAAPYGLPIKACHIGADAAARLAECARAEGLRACLALSDANTYVAGGDAVSAALTDAGLSLRQHQLGGEPFDATDTLGDDVAAAAEGSDGIVAIGSGTLCDLAKYAGDTLKKPVLLYPTAASMNGYTSAITALKVRGLKRTIPCVPAMGVFANPADVATAPQRMTAAGVADFLSKCSSTTDWRASHILLDVAFDPKARDFFEGIQDRLLAAAPAVGRGEPEAVAVALEALLLSGFSMVVAGSSAPASGGEHLISHYLDMKAALYGTRHDLHGTQVGVATVYCMGLWERVLALEPEEVDFERLIAARPTEAQIQSWIEEDWGPEVGAEVQAQWDGKKMDGAAFRRFLDRFRSTCGRLKAELPIDLLPAATVSQAIADAGGPTQPEDLDAPLEEYRNAQQRARYIRNRFTVLDLAHDLGLT